jgi:hypothetical protein
LSRLAFSWPGAPSTVSVKVRAIRDNAWWAVVAPVVEKVRAGPAFEEGRVAEPDLEVGSVEALEPQDPEAVGSRTTEAVPVVSCSCVMKLPSDSRSRPAGRDSAAEWSPRRCRGSGRRKLSVPPVRMWIWKPDRRQAAPRRPLCRSLCG